MGVHLKATKLFQIKEKKREQFSSKMLFYFAKLEKALFFKVSSERFLKTIHKLYIYVKT
jgi:hypothetical protein